MHNQCFQKFEETLLEGLSQQGREMSDLVEFDGLPDWSWTLDLGGYLTFVDSKDRKTRLIFEEVFRYRKFV